ncbi:hypothetical protein L226DRAFT_276241 [Lentinus tigrinus ALCF2SS1-7]|uniref:F-box domain-containing protein n=1 Tax=Lentinus tigrinus ALCF2SS1-6 TaxID=1328759 RepID=A0A5C2RS61_9APHY|nr:hypothetical protein L227DRAFT_347330 [Lentinus tigrinus ALCF2SS1-6]RPD69345.1 hypothetical protein L226DRAFT_276241 [Lentinus tigrinus ALCF2SS1-7]
MRTVSPTAQFFVPSSYLLDEDTLESLASHFDARTAARAALVSRHWYHVATPVAYAHIFLHTGSWKSTSALSRTLLQYAHLRRHVKHLTVIHCARYFPYMGNLLYAWLSLVPERSLRSCRAIGGAALVGTLLAAPAVRSARHLAALTLFYKTSDVAIPHVEVLKCHPEHARFADWRHSAVKSECGFLRGLFPHFQVQWGPDTRNTLYLSVASPAAEGGVSLSQLGDFLKYALHDHLARANFVVLTLGYTPCTLPTGRELCEAGLAQVTRNPSRCQCASSSKPFINNVPSSDASVAVCAALVGGEPFPEGTMRSMLECMDSRRGPAVWAHVAIVRVAGVPRGRVCDACGVQLYAVFHLSSDT